MRPLPSYSLAQLSEITGRSVSTLQKMAQKHQWGHLEGRQLRFYPHELDTVLNHYRGLKP